MTLVAFFFMVVAEIPIFAIPLAMCCDTILIASAMFTGVIGHHGCPL